MLRENAVITNRLFFQSLVQQAFSLAWENDERVWFSSFLSGYIKLETWVTSNRWDEDVTTNALMALSTLNRNHALFLIVLIAVSALHIFNSLLLILGALFRVRLAMLPWMIQVNLLWHSFLTINGPRGGRIDSGIFSAKIYAVNLSVNIKLQVM